MKKYMMFMFCVVFVVCLVCCGSKDKDSSGNVRRLVQYGNPTSPKSADGSATPDSSPTPEVVTPGTDPADSRMLVEVNKRYRFTITVDMSTIQGTIKIEDVGSPSKKASVDLAIARGRSWRDIKDLLKANAKELGIKINGDDDSNKIYVTAWQIDDHPSAFLMYHAKDKDSFDVETAVSSRASMMHSQPKTTSQSSFTRTLNKDSRAYIFNISEERDYCFTP